MGRENFEQSRIFGLTMRRVSHVILLYTLYAYCYHDSKCHMGAAGPELSFSLNSLRSPSVIVQVGDSIGDQFGNSLLMLNGFPPEQPLKSGRLDFQLCADHGGFHSASLGRGVNVTPPHVGPDCSCPVCASACRVGCQQDMSHICSRCRLASRTRSSVRRADAHAASLGG